VLTAAHCLTNASGALITTNSTVFFDFGSGTQTLNGSAYFVSPLYNPALSASFDIAIIALNGTPASQIPRYDVYRGNSEGGQAVAVVGYGLGGYGATGQDGVNYPFGTRRAGFNQYEVTFNGGTILGFDFDDGTTAHDAFGVNAGIPNLGLGTNEVNIGSGDSGGPTFIGCPLNCRIAGVHSFGLRLGSGDIDGTLNSSFGEVAGDTRVSANQAFLDTVLLPEPSTLFLTASGLLVLLRSARRRYTSELRR